RRDRIRRRGWRAARATPRAGSCGTGRATTIRPPPRRRAATPPITTSPVPVATSPGAAAHGRARAARSSWGSCRRSPRPQQRPKDSLDRLPGVESHDRGGVALRQGADPRLALPPCLLPTLVDARALEDAQPARQAGAKAAVRQALFLQRIGDPVEAQVGVRGERRPETVRLRP